MDKYFLAHPVFANKSNINIGWFTVLKFHCIDKRKLKCYQEIYKLKRAEKSFSIFENIFIDRWYGRNYPYTRREGLWKREQEKKYKKNP